VISSPKQEEDSASTLRIEFIFHFSPVFVSQIAVLCRKKEFHSNGEDFSILTLGAW
jgi:hypothetical protein